MHQLLASYPDALKVTLLHDHPDGSCTSELCEVVPQPGDLDL